MPATIYKPEIATAKSLYNKRYNDGNLTFENFLILTKQNCYYCGTPPNNKLKSDSKNNSQYYKDNCEFIYNGLDRINNDLPHDQENVVPCCANCNIAKSNHSYEEFMNWIAKIKLEFLDTGKYRKLINE